MSRARKESSPLNPLLWVAGAILILYFARAVLIPLALALTLNFLLTPMVTWLQRRRISRVPSVALVMLVFTAVLVGMGWVVTGQLLQVASDLPKYQLNIHDKIESLHLPPESALGRAAESIKGIEADFVEPSSSRSPELRLQNSASNAAIPVQVVAPQPTGLHYVSEMSKPLLQPLATAGMVLIFTVFILINQEDLRDRFLRLAGVGQLHAMTLALNDAGQRISRYLVMQFLVNAGYGLCFGLGTYAIGVPNAVLWGVIAGLFRIVPYAGAMSATAFPFILALALFHGWAAPLLVVLLFAVLDLLASNVVEPWLYGAHTGISSLALLVTTVFWTLLWGWAGLVLAVPLTVCVIVLGRYVPRIAFLQVLLGDETALSVDAQFYQRLLAMDQDDARNIVHNFLKTNSLISLYDTVFIPALALAEQDRHKGALGETRETFLFLSTSEIVSELAMYRPQDVAPRPRRLMARWRPSHANALAEPAQAEPASSTTRVFCLAANDRADEIAASMLAQLLERAGHGVISLPLESQFEEILQHLPPGPQDVICISALPPFAFAQAASLCQRVRLHLPEIKVLAGIWGSAGDVKTSMERFGSARPDMIVSTLAQALDQISEWRIQAEQENGFSSSASTSDRVGLS